MRHTWILVAALAVLFALPTLADEKAPKTPEEAKAPTEEKAPELSQMQKVSYCIGLDMGGNFRQMELELDMDMLTKGISDGLADKEPAFGKDEIRKTMAAFQKDMMAKQKELMEKRKQEMEKQGVKNKEESEKFLAENKKKEGVVTTDSGLQYIVLEEGKGDSPKDTDEVTVHYKGALLDGTVFDSSYDRGKPSSFPVNGVIKGWTEALRLMKPGSKYKLFIPSDLAYGARGAGRDIGPNATLIFEVELLNVTNSSAKEETSWF